MPGSPDAMSDSLARSPLFQPLSPGTRVEILRRLRPVHFDAGRSIFSRGEAADGLYMLESGGVGLTFTTSDGRELRLTYATVGAVFGEVSALDGGLRSADATALTEVAAHILVTADLQELLDGTPGFARATIQFLCARLRDTDQKLEAIAVQSIEARLAKFLASAAAARAGGSAKRNVPIMLSVSPSDIGLVVGASRTQVTAALALLEEAHAFRRDGESIVCNIPFLNQIAEQGWG